MKAQTVAIILLIISFATSPATAQNISVVDVKRNITLSDTDTVYKDFYLNAGNGSALKKNMVVNVKRKINIKDAATKSIGDIEAVVGQLKVIHVGSKVSVAREYKLIPRDEEPVLEQIGIMSGDHLDLTGSFIDNTKSVKPKTAEAELSTATDETKTVDASGVVNPKDETSTEKPADTREPANQPEAHPGNKSAVPVPQI